MDDFTPLDSARHMLEWLAEDPYAAIRSPIERLLTAQVPDTELTSIRVIAKPHYLTGARPSPDDANKAIVTRLAVAIAVELSVTSGGGADELQAIYTWAGVHLDEPGERQQRVWIDFDGTLEAFGSEGELVNRIYFE